MLNMFELLLPLILIALISLPLVNVFRGKKSVSVAKRRMLLLCNRIGNSVLQCYEGLCCRC